MRSLRGFTGLVLTDCSGMTGKLQRCRLQTFLCPLPSLLSGPFFLDDAAWPELRSQVEAWLQASLWSWDIEKVITEDWANTWKAYYLPITLEDGYSIIPAWRDDLKGNERTIWLDPGMAFGTGTHPTTEMCLRSIATIVRLLARYWTLERGPVFSEYLLPSGMEYRWWRLNQTR